MIIVAVVMAAAQYWKFTRGRGLFHRIGAEWGDVALFAVVSLMLICAAGVIFLRKR